MKKVIETTGAPAPIGPYNQAILVDKTLYASGQIALDPKTMELVNEDIQAETTQVMKNLSAVLKAAGMDFTNVVKATIYLADMGDFALVNEIYGGYFNDDYAPARETVQVAQLPKNVRVEISVIAIL
ncbi:MAG: RidA family protein [Flavobacteriaceae bacterium]